MRQRTLRERQLRVLDFDTECRPMHYSEFRAESQMTGWAASWFGDDTVYCMVLEQDLSNEREMLVALLALIDEADMLVGHYLRRHDLPLLSDHALRAGLSLGPKLTQDTMSDLKAVRALGKSQDNLSTALGISAEKHHMAGANWRVANALTPEGRAGTRKRVIDDVLQNKQLRDELLRRGVLKAPRVWKP